MIIVLFVNYVFLPFTPMIMIYIVAQMFFSTTTLFSLNREQDSFSFINELKLDNVDEVHSYGEKLVWILNSCNSELK